MEKLKTQRDYSFSYPFIIFYKEDLERLTELFFKNFSEIEIEADDFKLEDINEINDIQKEFIQFFKLAGYDKINENSFRECKIRFNITKKAADLYINDYNELKCRGIQNELETIVKRRNNLLNIFNSNWLFLINSLLMIFALELIWPYKNVINPIDFIMLMLLVIIVFCILGIALIYSPNLLSNKIMLRYSWEKLGFVKRNIDNIIVGVICAIFGTVIGGLIVYFITIKFFTLAKP
jgi:hypothetical protein